METDRIERAKNIKMISVMQFSGCDIMRDTTVRAWYLSPFRSEAVSSFIVYKESNSWYDWGTGVGGDTIDFVMKFNSCSFSEAINILLQDGDKRLVKNDFKREDVDMSLVGIDILDVYPIRHPFLISYAKSRGIDYEVLATHCKEVQYCYRSWSYVTHTAIGFVNDKGGWELRNHTQKIGNSPKSWSTVRGVIEDGDCDVFEGFFDFLSHMQITNSAKPKRTTLILNSLSFAPFIVDEVKYFNKVNLYFDNDAAAQMKIEEYFKGDKYIDMRNGYKDHADYNVYLQFLLNNK